MRSASQGASTQWTAPVTGSSSMPSAGANTRTTESMPSRSPAAAAATMCPPRARMAALSGVANRTAAAVAPSTSVHPFVVDHTPTTAADGTPTAGPQSGGSATGVAAWPGSRG